MWSVCNSPALLVELQNGTAVLLQFLIMLNKLLYHTAILPLSINPREGKTYTCIKICTQTSLAVQWLKLHASTAGSTGSIPGEGTKIPHAIQHSHKQTKNLYTNVGSSSIHNDKKLETPTCPEFTKQDISMRKNTVGNKKKQTIDSHNLDESQKHSSLKRLCTI